MAETKIVLRNCVCYAIAPFADRRSPFTLDHCSFDCINAQIDRSQLTRQPQRKRALSCSRKAAKDDKHPNSLPYRLAYRPDGDPRHWVKAALVVRIIFHPSPSRLAISCAVSAVIPHATLWARQARRMV